MKWVFQASVFVLGVSFTVGLSRSTRTPTLPPPTTATGAPLGCSVRADIVFLIDSSGSVGRDNFRTMKKFVNTIISNFKIGPDDVQVGIIMYAKSTDQIALNEHHVLKKIQRAITRLSYTAGGNTYTGRAISFMRTTSFTTRNGGRAGVPKIAVVITDGLSQDDIDIPSNAARSGGIKIFSVGVGGQRIDLAQLNAMASRPVKEHVFSVQGFDGLKSIKSAVTAKICQAAPKPTTTMKSTLVPTQLSTTYAVASTLKPTTSTPKPTKSATKLSTELTTVTNTPSTATPVSPIANVTLVKTTVALKSAGPKPTTTMKLTPSPTKPSTTNPVTSTLRPAISTPNPTQFTTKPPTEATTVTNAPNTGPPVSPIVNVTLDNISVEPTKTKCACTCTSTNGVHTSVTQFHTTPEFLSNTTTAAFTTTAGSATTVTPKPTAAASSTTPGSPGCVDTFEDCGGLGSRVCAGLTTWAQEHCAAYCGFCHVTTPCQDEKSCDRYGDTICSAAPLTTWVDENSRKYCNRC